MKRVRRGAGWTLGWMVLLAPIAGCRGADPGRAPSDLPAAYADAAGDGPADAADDGAADAAADLGTDAGGASPDLLSTAFDGRDGPGAADAPPPAAAINRCMTADDCVQVEYYAPVASEADCYCRVCPSDFGRRPPINRAAHDEYRREWLMYCSSWQSTPRCFPQPCPLPAPPTCGAGGTCGFASVLPPVPIPWLDAGGDH
jgi:hypothetical protein